MRGWVLWNSPPSLSCPLVCWDPLYGFSTTYKNSCFSFLEAVFPFKHFNPAHDAWIYHVIMNNLIFWIPQFQPSNCQSPPCTTSLDLISTSAQKNRITNLSSDDFEIRKTTSKINSGQTILWPDADTIANCEADINIPSSICNGLARIPEVWLVSYVSQVNLGQTWTEPSPSSATFFLRNQDLNHSSVV